MMVRGGVVVVGVGGYDEDADGADDDGGVQWWYDGDDSVPGDEDQ